jgi:PilZ domain
MNENRATHRNRVLKRGSITFSGGGIDCTVRNLSARGASLDVASPVGLPTNFTLVIEADHFSRRCHPVWSSPKRIGVAFD